MNIRACENFDYTLSVISRIKNLYDMGDDDIIDDIRDCSINEEFDVEGYEKVHEAAPFEYGEYLEDRDIEKYFCASEDMTEYYRLARKIGKLMGWIEENNHYIKEINNFVWKELRSVGDNYNFYEELYTGTRHKYASSLIIYVYPEFYEYWDLYFALREIFNNYSIQRKRLENEYQKLISSQYTAEMKEAA